MNNEIYIVEVTDKTTGIVVNTIKVPQGNKKPLIKKIRDMYISGEIPYNGYVKDLKFKLIDKKNYCEIYTGVVVILWIFFILYLVISKGFGICPTYENAPFYRFWECDGGCQLIEFIVYIIYIPIVICAVLTKIQNNKYNKKYNNADFYITIPENKWLINLI